MNLISIRENPKYKDKVIQYFQSKWGNESSNWSMKIALLTV